MASCFLYPYFHVAPALVHTHAQVNNTVFDHMDYKLCHIRNFLINLGKLFFSSLKGTVILEDGLIFILFYFILVRMVNMRSTLLTNFQCAQHSIVNNRHSVVWQISRIYSSCITEWIDVFQLIH